MRDGYTAQQVRDAEAPHLAAGEPLMARASAAVADAVREVLTEAHAGTGVVVLAGSGNNGGDALFAGAALAADGFDVGIVLVGSRVHEEALAAAQAAGARMLREDPIAALHRADVIVDGILGTGAAAHPALRDRAREIVAAALPLPPGGPAVVAVDIPSGIDPDSGAVPDGIVLPADVTVTFGGYKAGLLRGPAVPLAGRVRLAEIGIEADLARLTPAVRVP